MKHLLMILSMATLLCSCSGRPDPDRSDSSVTEAGGVCQPGADSVSFGNSIYYWKTVFKLSDWDQSFLQKYRIKRLYVKFFDVVYDADYDGEMKSIPSATILFKSRIPDGVELVPVIYITNEAIRADHAFAGSLYERVQSMCKGNHLGQIHEIQLDCDWSETTQERFFALCSTLRILLAKDNIKLSSTIRLHQLRKQAPPVDRGVLMMYNTGSLYDPDEENSILKASDVEPYLREDVSYPLPLSFAFPVFHWQVVFHNGKFQSIREDMNASEPITGDCVRPEYSSFDEIKKVKEILSSHLKNTSSGNIIYCLDEKYFSRFSDQEIKAIYK